MARTLTLDTTILKKRVTKRWKPNASFHLLHIRWDMLQHVATAISGFRQILPSQKFGFVKRDEKGGITTWKDLESSRLAR